jgi:hypothetical protein
VSLRDAIFLAGKQSVDQMLHDTDPLIQTMGMWRRDTPAKWYELLLSVGIDVQQQFIGGRHATTTR